MIWKKAPIQKFITNFSKREQFFSWLSMVWGYIYMNTFKAVLFINIFGLVKLVCSLLFTLFTLRLLRYSRVNNCCKILNLKRVPCFFHHWLSLVFNLLCNILKMNLPFFIIIIINRKTVICLHGSKRHNFISILLLCLLLPGWY